MYLNMMYVVHVRNVITKKNNFDPVAKKIIIHKIGLFCY